jgi:hypothetical protein
MTEDKKWKSIILRIDHHEKLVKISEFTNAPMSTILGKVVDAEYKRIFEDDEIKKIVEKIGY